MKEPYKHGGDPTYPPREDRAAEADPQMGSVVDTSLRVTPSRVYRKF